MISSNWIKLKYPRSFAAASIFSLASSSVFAAGFSSRAAPILFHPYDDKVIPTTACMDVTERRYDNPNWIATAAGTGVDAVENALIRVLAALRAGERHRVLELSDPEHGRDPVQFNTQYTAFVQQLKAVRLGGVEYAYRIGQITVFFMRIELPNKPGIQSVSPFAFQTHEDGSVWFLPYRSTDLSFMLLQDWFNSEAGPMGRQPQYCAAKVANGTRYRLPLERPHAQNVNAASRDTGPVPALKFYGTPVAASARMPVVQLFGRIVAAAGRNDLSTITATTTADGAQQLNEIRSVEERGLFLADLAKRRPTFLIDLGDAAVLYTRANDVQPLYFAKYGNEWKWVNISTLNLNSRVFGRESMLAQAAASQPFAEMRIP